MHRQAVKEAWKIVEAAQDEAAEQEEPLRETAEDMFRRAVDEARRSVQQAWKSPVGLACTRAAEVAHQHKREASQKELAKQEQTNQRKTPSRKSKW